MAGVGGGAVALVEDFGVFVHHAVLDVVAATRYRKITHAIQRQGCQCTVGAGEVAQFACGTYGRFAQSSQAIGFTVLFFGLISRAYPIGPGNDFVGAIGFVLVAGQGDGHFAGGRTRPTGFGGNAFGFVGQTHNGRIRACQNPAGLFHHLFFKTGFVVLVHGIKLFHPVHRRNKSAGLFGLGNTFDLNLDGAVFFGVAAKAEAVHGGFGYFEGFFFNSSRIHFSEFDIAGKFGDFNLRQHGAYVFAEAKHDFITCCEAIKQLLFFFVGELQAEVAYFHGFGANCFILGN